MAIYLIDFKNNASAQDINSYFSSNNIRVIKTFNYFDKIFVAESDTFPVTTSIIDTITLNDSTTSISPLEIVPVIQTLPSSSLEINTANVNDWWKCYSVRNVDFSNEVQNIDKYGESTIVYMVDSGIDINHTDFVNKNIQQLWSVNDNFSDSTGHGTALSSLIIGETCGLTSSILKVIKLWDSTHTTLQSDIISALDAIIQDYLNSSEKFAVVNMSWAIPKNTFIENKIQIMIDLGISVVAASGNSGVPIENVTPASMPDVITIGSFNQDFNPSNFSNYSHPLDTSLTSNETNFGQLDGWAPGEQIYVAKVNGGYGYSAGTSCSAAIFTGSLLYNVSQMLFNNDLLSFYRNENKKVKWEVLVSSYRSGLLEFTDNKYNGSVNKICTYYNNRRTPHNEFDGVMKIIARVGETVSKDFFVYELAESYEIITSLPPTVTIERQWMFFSPTEDLADPTSLQVDTIYYNVKGLNGITYPKSIDLITLGSQFNRESLPPNDPLISITELDLCRSAAGPNCPFRPCVPVGYICLTDYPAKVCYCGF